MSPPYRAVQNAKWPSMWEVQERGVFGKWKYMHSGTKEEAQAILDALMNPQVIYPSTCPGVDRNQQ